MVEYPTPETVVVPWARLTDILSVSAGTFQISNTPAGAAFCEFSFPPATTKLAPSCENSRDRTGLAAELKVESFDPVDTFHTSAFSPPAARRVLSAENAIELGKLIAEFRVLIF